MSDNFFWNVRGINDISKHRPLALWLKNKKVTFGAFLETHVREINKDSILLAISPNWSLLANYQYSELGWIWIIYRSSIQVLPLFLDAQSITVQVTLESGISFVYSAVYASNEVDERRGLWSSLQDTLVSFGLDSKPWMVVGDFNESLGPHESSNVACVSSTSSMREFGEVLCQLGLVDLPSQGPRFTWSNHQPSTPIAKRLDRCLVNNEWLAQFPTAHCSFEPPDFSDHTPCHIRLSSPPPSFGTKAFMFNCALLSLPSFLPTIRLAWEDLDSGNGLLSGLCFKLKKIKMVVRDIAKENFSHIEKRVLQAEDDLRVCQIKSLDDPTPDNFEIERKVRTLWISLRLAEECFFRQRSRNKWLEGGDLNTQFFHSLMIFRNGSNAIKYLLRSDGSRSVSLEEVHQIAERHFSSVLQDIKGDYCVSLKDLLNIIIIFKCSDPKQVIIGAEISSEVIKETLFKMPKSRTPGPDGFPCEFFQATWSFIGEEVLKAVHYFFRAPFMSTALNSTSLVLIPKRPGAECIEDFRPISCLNTLYKLITKII